MTWPLAEHLRASGTTVVSGAHYLVAQCDHAALAAAMRVTETMADALVVDAPYSARTHEGHDNGAAAGMDGRGADYRERVAKPSGGTGARRAIDYLAWSPDDVSAFVGAWSPCVRGWIGSLTDHALAPAWEAAMAAAYRYTFSPLACVESGSRVRLGGDGPSQWSTWLVVSRPRSREWQSWGTLPGAYVGGSEKKAVTGGKPLWLMRAIVGDYSAPGDIVCDPCMGAGTTLVAAVQLGRFGLGCEPDAGRFGMACKRLETARPQLRMRLDDVETVAGKQSALALTEDT